MRKTKKRCRGIIQFFISNMFLVESILSKAAVLTDSFQKCYGCKEMASYLKGLSQKRKETLKACMNIQ